MTRARPFVDTCSWVSKTQDCREQMEIAIEEDTTKATAARCWPDYYHRLRGANQFPTEAQPTLQPTVMEYANHLIRISQHLVEALGLALGLERSAFDYLFQNDPFWQLKLASSKSMASQEPETNRQQDENDTTKTKKKKTYGVGAHTDTGFFTLLLQDDVGGLQVCVDGENWIDVPPTGPNVLVCNLGEVAQVASGGYLLATPHRVIVSNNHNSRQQRISVPFFYNPNLSAVVKEPLEIGTDLWEPDVSKEWHQPKNVMHSHYGKNAFKSLARSHPAVFQKFHGDLQLLENGSVAKR